MLPIRATSNLATRPLLLTPLTWLAITTLTWTTWADSVGIERSQRELQARYAFLNLGVLQWPDCSCGPAPAYPKDGFYGDIIQDKQLGVRLTADLAGKFYNEALYGNFLNITTDDISGASQPPANFTAADFPAISPTNITETNYLVCLPLLQRYIRQLRYTTGDIKQSALTWWEGGYYTYFSCSDAENTASSLWDTNSWEGFSYNPEFPATDSFTHVGMREATVSGPDYGAFLQAISGTLTNSASANCKLYAKLTDFADGFSNLQGFQPNTNFQHLTDLAAGQTYTLGATKPTFSTTDCPTAERGWQIAQLLAILTPTFDPPIDSLSCGGACGSGECQATFGGVQADTPFPGFRVSLGQSTQQRAAGALFLEERYPSAALSTPALLRLAQTSDTTNYPSEGVLQQIVTPQGLVDITIQNSTQYTISCYPGTYPGGVPNTPVGDPISQIVVQANGSTNSLQITETIPETRIKQFTYDPANQTWTRTVGLTAGTQIQTYQSLWDEDHTLRTENLQIKDGDGTVRYSEQNQYQIFAWGTELVCKIVGLGSDAPLTNSWTFYTDSSQTNTWGHLASTTMPGGKWESYTYDTNGRPSQIISQYRNNPIDSDPSTNRTTTYQYSDSAPQLTVITKLPNDQGSPQVVAQSTLSSSPTNYDFQLQLTLWNQTNTQFTAAGSALSTITTFIDDSSYPPRPHRIVNPDATLQTYQYIPNQSGGTNVIICSGEPGANGGGINGIQNGTCTTRESGRVGETKSIVTQDISGGLLGIILSSETNACDQLGRATNITYLDGMAQSFTYACCGLESMTSREGVTTSYLYDALKRRYQDAVSVDNGQVISTLTTLDAAGNALQVTRIGTNQNNVISRSASYDTAGRILYQTNALGGVTTHIYTATSHAQVFPDGGTQTNSFNQDGTLDQVTGTAAAPVRYEYGVDANGRYTKEIKLNDNWGDTDEWTKTYVDFLGRTVKVAYPDSNYRQTIYNQQGQLQAEIDPDQVTTVFQYNAKGELWRAATDAASSTDINLGGKDRITEMVASDLSAAAGGRDKDIHRVDICVFGLCT